MSDGFASAIEVSFQGGIGVAAGMRDAFEQAGAAGAADVTLALAPAAMLSGLLIGIFFINLHHRKGGTDDSAREEVDASREEETGEAPQETRCNRLILVQLALVGIAILFGILILDGLTLLEDRLLKGVFYDTDFIKHIPVFPMALLGGIVVQFLLERVVRLPCANPDLIRKIQPCALNLLIVMAMAGISLRAVGDHIGTLGFLLVSGLLWNVGCFLVLPKLFFARHAFERGIADFGQSMGTTSIGLVLLTMVDPHDRSGAKQAFGFKQLLFEPFVGGGIITAISPLLIENLGLPAFTGVALGLCCAFAGFGLLLGHRARNRTT